jgi:hypothetical protein
MDATDKLLAGKPFNFDAPVVLFVKQLLLPVIVLLLPRLLLLLLLLQWLICY